MAPIDATTPAQRIGITGSPGAGKSSLIGQLIHQRLARGRRLAVIAIDPSSPNTHGSVLGDRLRMDALFDHPNLYIRSLPSGGAHDGISENLPEILELLEIYGFDEIIVETVGVGQAEYGVRVFVDTEVLVLVPEAGDHVQAMKCGILETGDIYVVNKADLSGAERMAAELRGVLTARSLVNSQPPVLLTSERDQATIAELDQAIEAHLVAVHACLDAESLRRSRRQARVHTLIQRELAALIETLPEAIFTDTLASAHATVLKALTESR